MSRQSRLADKSLNVETPEIECPPQVDGWLPSATECWHCSAPAYTSRPDSDDPHATYIEFECGGVAWWRTVSSSRPFFSEGGKDYGEQFKYITPCGVLAARRDTFARIGKMFGQAARAFIDAEKGGR